MILLSIGVATIFCLAAGLIALASAPAQLDKTVRQRLAAIESGDARTAATGLEAPELLKEDRTGQTGWLHTVLERYAFSQKLQGYIAQGAGSTSVAGLILLSFALAIIGFGLVYLVAPILPVELLGSCAFGVIPFLYIAWRRSRRINAFGAALPEAIDMMARALRAGHSMARAIEMVAQDAAEPVAAEFSEVFKQQNFGLPLRQALMQMLERVPSQDLRVCVTAILVQRETGGNLVEVLDRTAFIIRDRLRIHGEIRVHTAQGRMTGWTLSLLPFVMLFLINLVNPGYSRILLVDPFGRKLVYIGVALIAVGAAAIHRIVNGIEV